VGERTSDAPLAHQGDPSRQKGPSRLACVGLSAPALLMRQTSAETPSEPAISTTSLWNAVVF
jgi:hypothetical protein